VRGLPGDTGISARRFDFGMLAHRFRPSFDAISERFDPGTRFQRSSASDPTIRLLRFGLFVIFENLKLNLTAHVKPRTTAAF
jgi:hypothetical protein